MAAEGNLTPNTQQPYGATMAVDANYARGAGVPWQLKVALKLAFGWAPRPWLNALRINRASHRAEEDEAMIMIPLGLCAQFDVARGRQPLSVLEFGPGAMVAQCVAFAGAGADPIVLIDQTPLASMDAAPFHRAAAALKVRGDPAPDLAGAHNAAAAFAACRTTYLSGGLAALRALPDEQFDLVASSAVLEHINRAELPETLFHLRRVMRRDGYALHGIDLHDHFGGGLNSLRFPAAIWEHPFVARCGLYTNRWGERAWREGLTAAGFTIDRLDRAVWATPPIDPAKVHRDVGRGAEDLTTAWMVVGLSRSDRPMP